MDCNFTERISLLVDGELKEEEAKEARAHLAACDVCRKAHSDFLSLRGEIKAYASEPDPAAQRLALRRILVPDKPPLWRRSVSLPAPVFALLLVMLVALGVWSAVRRRPAPPAHAEAGTEPGKVLTAPAATEGAQGGIDLARFDRGGRAAIYKVRREGRGDVEQ